MGMSAEGKRSYGEMKMGFGGEGVRTDSWTAGDGRSLEPIILQSPVSVYTLGGSTRLKIL